jgi:dehydrogenase/reductase SDR family member 12
MARFTTTLRVDQPRERVFEYLADFSQAATWDPGVVAGEKLTPGPVRLGSRFELIVRFLGRSAPLEYVILAYEPPQRVVFHSRNGWVESTDELTFRSITKVVGRDRTEVTYDAVLEPRGWARVLAPGMSLAFGRIGRRARAGLEAALADPTPRADESRKASGS